jgi:hypothetical protein
MKLFVYIIVTYAVALALAGLALTGFGTANYMLDGVSGARVAVFVLSFTAGIALLYWNEPPRWWVAALGWVGLYVMFLVVAVATNEQNTTWLLAFTVIGVVPFFGVFAAVLGVVHWALTAAAFRRDREAFAFARVLQANPLGVAWFALALVLFVALGFEMMLGDPDRMYDAARRAVGPLGFDWYSYGGEQTLFRVALIGVMGAIGVAFARLIKVEPPLPILVGFAVGGALVAQVWHVPIYQPSAYERAFDIFSGPYALLSGAVAGAACGAFWFAAAQWRASWGRPQG